MHFPTTGARWALIVRSTVPRLPAICLLSLPETTLNKTHSLKNRRGLATSPARVRTMRIARELLNFNAEILLKRVRHNQPMWTFNFEHVAV